MPISDECYRLAIAITHLFANILRLTLHQQSLLFPAVCRLIVLQKNPCHDFGHNTLPEIMRAIAGDERSQEFFSQHQLRTYSQYSNVFRLIVSEYEIYVDERNEKPDAEISLAEARHETGYITNEEYLAVIESARARRLPKIRFNSQCNQVRFLLIAQLYLAHLKLKSQKGIFNGSTPGSEWWNEWKNSQGGQETSEYLDDLKEIAQFIADS